MSIIDTVKLSLDKDQLDNCLVYLALSHYINSLTEILDNPLDIEKEEIELLKFLQEQSIRLVSELSSLIENIPYNEEQ